MAIVLGSAGEPTPNIASAAMSGIAFLLALVFAALVLFTVHRRKDPVRSAVPWLRAALLLIAANLLCMVAAGVTGCLDYDVSDRASKYLTLTAVFFEQTASCATLIAFVELGLGFLRAKALGARAGTGAGTARPTGYKIIGIANAVGVGLLLILAIAALGISIHAYSSAGYHAVRLSILRLAYNMIGVFDIIMFVFSTLLIALGAVVVHKSRHMVFKKAAGLYLGATIIWFFRYLWLTIYSGLWLLGSSSRGPKIESMYIDPILNAWLFVAVLVLLFFVLARHQGGLWSTRQPWTPVAPPVGADAYTHYDGIGNAKGSLSPPPLYDPHYAAGARSQQPLYHEMMGQPAAVRRADAQELYTPQRAGAQELYTSQQHRAQELYVSQHDGAQEMYTPQAYQPVPPSELKS